MNDPTSQHSTIRTFAVITVAVTSIFVMAMAWWLTTILAAPDWCARAINAEKLSAVRSTSEFGGCKDLLFKQVGSIALNSHIYAGITALCLLVLIVIVIAGGKLSFTANKDGVTANIDKDKVDGAVDRVVDAAAAEGQAVKEGA